MIRIEMEAVADGEALTGLLACGDHDIALGGRNSHRLLADDVLARAECGDDVLGMDTGRRDHVNDIDVLIRGDFVPFIVAVDGSLSETMGVRQLLALGTSACDGRDQLHVGRLE